jgi:hypothetical protein
VFVTVIHRIHDPEGFQKAETKALEAGLPSHVALQPDTNSGPAAMLRGSRRALGRPISLLAEPGMWRGGAMPKMAAQT